ncbi:hypothetical protein SteCoe_39701 [Stentor coeruleus]|uniref:Uncharacterized protein n=1 Tax=Stentor coeruleus TaxID=5963 RepID=A0A1R2AKS6_9CILI|nr:hypothetical protein SteCoe_39701 [Stentor coeruleus]
MYPTLKWLNSTQRVRSPDIQPSFCFRDGYRGVWSSRTLETQDIGSLRLGWLAYPTKIRLGGQYCIVLPWYRAFSRMKIGRALDSSKPESRIIAFLIPVSVH